MIITVERNRGVQYNSKLISRLSSYCSLKLVKKVKNAQRSGPLEISGKIRGKRYNAKPLGMLYNANNSRKQTRGAKKKEDNKEVMEQQQLEGGQKVKKCKKI